MFGRVGRYLLRRTRPRVGLWVELDARGPGRSNPTGPLEVGLNGVGLNGKRDPSMETVEFEALAERFAVAFVHRWDWRSR